MKISKKYRYKQSSNSIWSIPSWIYYVLNDYSVHLCKIYLILYTQVMLIIDLLECLIWFDILMIWICKYFYIWNWRLPLIDLDYKPTNYCSIADWGKQIVCLYVLPKIVHQITFSNVVFHFFLDTQIYPGIFQNMS